MMLHLRRTPGGFFFLSVPFATGLGQGQISESLDTRNKSDEEKEDLYLYRWGHSVVSVPSGITRIDSNEVLDTLLIIGGVHQAFSESDDKRTQILVKSMPTLSIGPDLNSVDIAAKSGTIPPIFGHSCKYVSSVYVVICVGGFDTASDIYLARSVYGVFLYDLRTKVWRSAAISELKNDNNENVVEYGLAESSMEIINHGFNRLSIGVIIGGRSQCYTCYNSSQDITRPRAKGIISYGGRQRNITMMNIVLEPAGGVYGHCTVSKGTFVYTLFGESHLRENTPLVRRLEIAPLKYTTGYTVSNLETIQTGTPTPPRRLYPACFLQSNQIFVFGGIEPSVDNSSRPIILQDSWKLDLQTLQWARLKDANRIGPGPRWRCASTTLAAPRIQNIEKRAQLNQAQVRDAEITGMVIHGGLTPDFKMEDSRLHFLRNTVTGGWRSIALRSNGNSVEDQDVSKSSLETNPRLNYYVQAIVGLLSLIFLLVVVYVLRDIILRRRASRAKKPETTEVKRESLAQSSKSKNAPKISNSFQSLLDDFSIKNARNVNSVNDTKFIDASIPSVALSRQMDYPPRRPSSHSTTRSLLSRNNYGSQRRVSSMNWSNNDIKKSRLASVPKTSYNETSFAMRSSSSTGGGIVLDLMKTYVVNQGFLAQRYDEVSLSVGDVCTLRIVFKDNWAVGMNVTTRRTGVIPLSCLKLDNGTSSSLDLHSLKYLEQKPQDGISCSVKLEIQKPLKDIDQLLESNAIIVDQYLDRRKFVLMSCK